MYSKPDDNNLLLYKFYFFPKLLILLHVFMYEKYTFLQTFQILKLTIRLFGQKKLLQCDNWIIKKLILINCNTVTAEK